MVHNMVCFDSQDTMQFNFWISFRENCVSVRNLHKTKINGPESFNLHENNKSSKTVQD